MVERERERVREVDRKIDIGGEVEWGKGVERVTAHFHLTLLLYTLCPSVNVPPSISTFFRNNY